MEGPEVQAAIPSVPNPYVGPRTFEIEEKKLFFGRDREASELLALVAARRLVLFYAESGAGKSSLINTRLIPGLEEERGFEILPVCRVGGEIPEAFSRESNIFIYNIMLDLDEHEEHPERFVHTPLKDFLLNLVRQPDGKFRYVHEEESADEPLVTNPNGHATTQPEEEEIEIWPRALIIDQFEEIFTTHPEFWHKREDFFRQISDAMEADPYLWVVLAMREDFVAKLAPYVRLLPGELRTRYYMQRMRADAALDAIRKPAAEIGHRPFAHSVDPEQDVACLLVNNLLQIQTEHEYAAQDEFVLGEFVEPVQLQVVCYQLWERLRNVPGEQITRAHLDQLTIGDGGAEQGRSLASFVTRSLRDFYETALEKVLAHADIQALAVENPQQAVSERRLRSWFEDELITPSQTRSLVPLNAKANTAGSLPLRAVELLQEQFIVRSESRGSTTFYELVHDRFVEPIRASNRAWQTRRAQEDPLLRTAQQYEQARNRRLLYTGQQLRSALASVEGHEDVDPVIQRFLDDSQKADQQRLARQFVGVVAVAIFALVTATFAGYQWFRANGEATAADQTAEAASIAKVTSDWNAEQARIAQQAAAQAEQLAQENAQLAEENAQLAQAEAKEAGAQRLANQAANALYTGYTERALLLSLAAHAEATTFEGEDALLRALDRGYHPHGQPYFSRQTWTLDNISVLQAATDPSGTLTAISSWDGRLLLWDLTTNQPVGEPLWAHSGQPIYGLAFSPDGRTLASASGSDYDTTERFTILLWDLADPSQPIARSLMADAPAVLDLDFSADGRWLAAAHIDRAVGLWDLSQPDSAPRRLEAEHESQVRQVRFSPTDHSLVSGDSSGNVVLWEGLDQERPAAQTIATYFSGITELTFSPDGKTLASGSYDGVQFWDVETHRQTAPDSLLGSVRSIAFHKSGQRMVVGYSSSPPKVWDVDTQTATPFATDLWITVIHAVLSTDSSTLLTVDQDRRLIRWNMSQSAALGETKPIPAAGSAQQGVLSPQGEWLVSHTRGQIDLWNLGARTYISQTLATQAPDQPLVAAFSADGRQLATVVDEIRVLLWHTAADALQAAALPDQPAPITSLAFAADGDLLAIATCRTENLLPPPPSNTSGNAGEETGLTIGGNETNVVTNAAAASQEQIPPTATPPATTDGSTTACRTAEVQLWDLAKNVPLLAQPLASEHGRVDALAFHPSADGPLLVAGSEDGTISIWDLAASGGDLARHEVSKSADGIARLVFSPTGTAMASVSKLGQVTFWHEIAARGADSSAPVGELLPDSPEAPVENLVFTPDGSRMISLGCRASSKECWLQFWDAATRQLIGAPLLHNAFPQLAMAYAAETEKLIAAYGNATVIEWQTNPDEWQKLACERAGRNFTYSEWLAAYPDSTWAATAPTATQSPLICERLGIVEIDVSFAEEMLAQAENSVRRCQPEETGAARRLLTDAANLKTNQALALFSSPDAIEERILELLTAQARTHIAQDRPQLARNCLLEANEQLATLNRPALNVSTILEVASALKQANENLSRREYLDALKELTAIVTRVPEASFQLGQRAELITAMRNLCVNSRGDMPIVTKEVCGHLTALAKPLLPNQPIQADRATALLWTFEGRAGQFINLAMDRVDAQLDPRLELIGPNAEQFITDDSGGTNGNAHIQNFRLASDGLYLVLAGDVTGNNGQYELALSDAQRPPLVPGVFPVDGGQKTAIWSFAAQAGEMTTINLKPTYDWQSYQLTLYDPVGAVVSYQWSRGIQSLVWPRAGDYTLLATNDDSSPYTLTVSAGFTRDRLALDRPISDTLAAHSYHDWSFYGQQGQVVSLTMTDTAEASVVALHLLDAERSLLVPSSSSVSDGTAARSGAIVRTYLLPRAGFYTVSAHNPSASPQPYRLLLAEAMLKRLTETGEVTGRFEEAVAWQFDGAAGQLIDVNLIWTTPNLHPQITILGPSGVNLAQLNAPTFDTSYLRLDNVLLLEDGLYTVVIGESSAGGPYRLSLTESSVAPVTIGGNPQSSTFAERKVWAFLGQEGQTVNLALNEGESSPNNWLLVFAPSGRLLTQSHGDYFENSLVRGLTLPEEGRYLVTVDGYSQSNSYSLTIDEEQMQGELAFDVAVTSTLTANLRHAWSFAGKGGQVIRIDLASSGESEMTAEIYGPNHVRLAATAPDEPSRIDSTPLHESGIYVVVVSANGDSQGTYTLRLTQDTPRPIAFNETVTGDFAADTTWRFQGKANGVAQIELTRQGTAARGLSLSLIQEDGLIVRTALDNVNEGTAVLPGERLPVSGAYIIRPGALGNVGSYSLTLSAGSTRTLMAGVTVTDTLDVPTDWSFSGQAGQVVNITMNAPAGSSLDPLLTLYDPDGLWADSDNDSGEGLNALLDNVVLRKDGIYTLLPRTSSGATSSEMFELRMDTSPPHTILIGESVQGNTAEPTAWTFSAQPGQLLTLAADAVSAYLNPFVTLVDAKGTFIAGNDNGGEGFNARIQSFVVPAEGEYQLLVGSANGVGDYTLSIREPISRPLTPDTPVAARVEDDIVWSFVAGPNQVLSATLQTENSLAGIDLLLVNAMGETLAIGQGPYSPQTPFSLGKLTFDHIGLTAGQRYGIIVRFAASSYINIESEPYTLLLRDVSATPLVDGEAQEGDVTDEDGIRWSFRANAGQSIAARMGTEGSFAPSLKLFGPTGTLMRLVETAAGQDAVIPAVTLPITGTYLLVANGSSGNSTGNYTITLTESDAPSIPQHCGMDRTQIDYGPVVVGQRVHLNAPRPLHNNDAWDHTMEQFIGTEAIVTALRGLDLWGCPTVNLDVYNISQSGWRIRDLDIVTE